MKYDIEIDNTRDDLLTNFGKAVLQDRYLLPDESFQGLFARVASHYANNQEHATRLYDYMSKLWFMPATPILSNGGTNRGLPISCFLNECEDSLKGIVDLWTDNVWLAARGGGIGSYWGNLRSIGEGVRGNGQTSGIIPFIAVQDRLTLAISQGSLRRGSSAIYLPIGHPEIEEFLELRKPTGGDPNRKSLNIHHGVVITDEFMQAVIKDAPWELRSPHNNAVIDVVKARHLWIKILTIRVETGEPYILFIDRVNEQIPEHHKELDLKVKTSNLCSEITLFTGKDHLQEERTGVCCLSSVNLKYFNEWSKDERFLLDVFNFLDNVLQDFIDNAPETMKRATYSAKRERSIGLGVMGFHTLLQSMNIPFGSVVAKSLNAKIFRHIRQHADEASRSLAEEKGACLDAQEKGKMERFTNKLAIAPTASISTIAGNCSPGIEPMVTNSFTQKTLTGSFNVTNSELRKVLQKYGRDTPEMWSYITVNEGSVQKLSFLSEHEKKVFKTAHEIDQRWIIELAADRTPFICQSQSVNLFLPANIHKRDLHQLHFQAWKKGMKSLYYCRSKSLQRAEVISNSSQEQLELDLPPKTDYDECLACQ